MFIPPGNEIKDEIPLPQNIQGWVNSKRGDPDFEHDIRMFEMNRGYYSHESNCQLSHYCKDCGKPEFKGSYVKARENILATAGLCFRCELWGERIGQRDQWLITAQGEFYKDHGNQQDCDEPKYLGHGGRTFQLHKFQDGSKVESWTTNNLWHGGRAPWFLLRKHFVAANAEVKEVSYSEKTTNVGY